MDNWREEIAILHAELAVQQMALRAVVHTHTHPVERLQQWRRLRADRVAAAYALPAMSDLSEWLSQQPGSDDDTSKLSVWRVKVQLLRRTGRLNSWKLSPARRIAYKYRRPIRTWRRLRSLARRIRTCAFSIHSGRLRLCSQALVKRCPWDESPSVLTEAMLVGGPLHGKGSLMARPEQGRMTLEFVPGRARRLCPAPDGARVQSGRPTARGICTRGDGRRRICATIVRSQVSQAATVVALATRTSASGRNSGHSLSGTLTGTAARLRLLAPSPGAALRASAQSFSRHSRTWSETNPTATSGACPQFEL